jgi:ADP-ribosylglycohydrolase
MEERIRLLNRTMGCLLGGASGSALGHPIKTLSKQEIKNRYGMHGLIYFSTVNEQGHFPLGSDVKYSLFATNGLINALNDYYCNNKPSKYLSGYIRNALFDYASYINGSHNKHSSILINKKELFNKIDKNDKTISIILNKKATAERDMSALKYIAPLGLVNKEYGDPFYLALSVASITNLHPLDILSAQLLVMFIHNLAYDHERTFWRIGKDTVRELAKHYKEAPKSNKELFNKVKEYVPGFIEYMKKPLIYVKYALTKNVREEEFDETTRIIEELGKGNKSEEAIAIAFYCAIRYQNDPAKAMKVSVNIDGDSELVSMITGQILGSTRSFMDIPDMVRTNIENDDIIEELAKDLALANRVISEEERQELINKYKC